MYLVTATKEGQVVRFRRPSVFDAATTTRRLRHLGWLVSVLKPGSWA